MRKWLLGGGLFLAALAFSIPVLAFGFKRDSYGVGGIGAVIYDDLYVSGGSVNVSSRVEGDLVGAGGNLLIGGDVLQDLTLAGGSLNILGSVGDDARLAGGNIIVGRQVGDDLVAMGGTIQVLPGSLIRGNVFLLGGQINLEGGVQGDAQINGDEVLINGPIRGNVAVEAGRKLVLGDSAYIQGELKYRAPSEVVMSDMAKVVGKISYEPKKSYKEQWAGAVKGREVGKWFLVTLGVLSFLKLLIVLVSGLVLYWVGRKCVVESVNYAVGHAGKSLVKGFVILVVVPVVIVLLCLTIVGALFGLAAGLLYAFLLVFAKIYAGVITGSLVRFYAYKPRVVVVNWKTVVGGIVLFHLLSLVPFVGWIIWLALFSVALGALVHHLVGKHILCGNGKR